MSSPKRREAMRKWWASLTAAERANFIAKRNKAAADGRAKHQKENP